MKPERCNVAAKVKLPSGFSVHPADVTAWRLDGDFPKDNLPSSATLAGAFRMGRRIAAAAQCSRRYLEKRFRKLLGVSVRDLVMREKIERAKNLLEKGPMPIGEIPAACGVSCNSHLSVLFKKATGVTMREWRHAHRDASDE